MGFPPDVEAKLGEILAAPLISTLRTRVETEPWDEDGERELRPLHFALVPPAVWKGSRFERSFGTSLGSVWEKAAIEVSRGGHDWVQQSYVYEGQIYSEQLHVIHRILGDLEAGRQRPDWNAEMAEVLAAAAGRTEPCRVIVDVAIGHSEGDKGSHEYFEIKSPKPNSDQTKVSKEKMLKLTAIERRECAYFALPFNPYGPTRASYTWSFPARWFDMRNDPVILIGVEFWERLGGPGTWDDLLEIAHREGAKYSERIEAYLLDD